MNKDEKNELRAALLKQSLTNRGKDLSKSPSKIHSEAFLSALNRRNDLTVSSNEKFSRARAIALTSIARKKFISERKSSVPKKHSSFEKSTLDASLKYGIKTILNSGRENKISSSEMETMISILVSIYTQAKVNMLVNQKMTDVFDRFILKAREVENE